MRWPEYFDHLLTWFWDIRNRTSPGEMGLNPISWDQIEAYERFLNKIGFEMTPIDNELLRRIDDIYITVKYEAGKPPPKKPAPTKH